MLQKETPTLKNGSLSGLSKIARSIPTKLEVMNNTAKLTVGLGVTGLESPFEASASLASPDLKPEELGELEPIVKPLVINPVRKKIIEILKGEVKELIEKKIQEYIPGVNALT